MNVSVATKSAIKKTHFKCAVNALSNSTSNAFASAMVFQSGQNFLTVRTKHFQKHFPKRSTQNLIVYLLALLDDLTLSAHTLTYKCGQESYPNFSAELHGSYRRSTLVSSHKALAWNVSSYTRLSRKKR